MPISRLPQLISLLLLLLVVVCPGAWGAVDFDGTDDYLLLDSSGTGRISNSTSGTFTAWVIFQTLAANDRIFGYGGGNVVTPGYLAFFLFNSGANYFLGVGQRSDGGVDNSVYFGSTILSTNTLYHVALVSTGTAWKIYLNGVEETLTASVGANNGDWFGDTTVAEADRTSLAATKYDDAFTAFLDAIIFDFAFWDSALSEAQIQQLYQSRLKRIALQISPSTLINYSPLDDYSSGNCDSLVYSDLSSAKKVSTGEYGAAGCLNIPETVLSYPGDE